MGKAIHNPAFILLFGLPKLALCLSLFHIAVFSIFTSSPIDMNQWYVANTRPGQEKRADTNIRRIGFDTFLPMMRTDKHVAKNRKSMLSPMFPGYIFVSLDKEIDRWGVINSAFGVKRLISNGIEPSPVPMPFVEALLKTQDQDGACSPDLKADLAAGDSVRILTGPFAETVATVTSMAAGERVKLLLSLLGGQISANVPRRSLLKLT